MNRKILAMHNGVLVSFLTCCALSWHPIHFNYPDNISATILSYISISIPFPIYVPAIVTLIACSMPLPLFIHFARRSGTSPTAQPRVWVSMALIQLFGGISSCSSMIDSEMFAIVHATFLALWVGGMMLVFQSRSRLTWVLLLLIG